MALHDDQRAICGRYGALFQLVEDSSIAGVSRNLGSGGLPLNGLRHLPEGQTCGWYLWAGELSQAEGFFEPVHVSHLREICPDVLPYLGMAPGWRFLLAPGYVDVWYDVKLLAPNP